MDLARVLSEARMVKRILRAFPTYCSKPLLEHSAIAGGLEVALVNSNPQSVADAIARRLDAAAKDYERGWQGRPTQDGGLRFFRTLRGVEENLTLDGPVLRSGEARKLNTFTKSLQETYRAPALLERKQRTVSIFTPSELLDAIFSEGEKGLTLQRYKGLGEMNPSQLWETTLDPGARTLVQVKIQDVAEANDLFIKLMGDEVEPRRDFIVRNALSVENLDL